MNRDGNYGCVNMRKCRARTYKVPKAPTSAAESMLRLSLVALAAVEPFVPTRAIAQWRTASLLG
jgi:hypothetical protein